MRLCALGSGSRGNATLIDSGSSRILIDCGFAARELAERAEHAGFDLATLDAILVTHEHGDHIRGVGAVARKYNVPVYCSHGSQRSGKLGNLPAFHCINPHQAGYNIGDIQVEIVAVPHDAAEPCQFVFSANGKRLGILTDLGCITPNIIKAYEQLDMLLLEANHDTQMLHDGPYPPALQARVGGDYGHLNNQQSMSLLENINSANLQKLILGHLSEKNNHPDKVIQALQERCEHLTDRYQILQQDYVSEWFAID